MDAVNVSAWEGRTIDSTGCVSADMARQIEVTLGGDPDAAPGAGEALPPLWHWCAFAPAVAGSELGPDGHPHTGDFLPPLHLSRRMWAGSVLEFGAPVAVGDRLRRRSTLLRVDEKERAGKRMVFVTVGHELRAPRGLAVRERQTIVYLDIPPVFEPPKKRGMPANPAADETFPVNETTLFRFSSVTFNAHRIHYDLPYTQNVEHYPGLVIHGPLQAMLLMRLAERRRGGPPSVFEFRGVHPMFLGADLDLAAVEDAEGGLELFAGQSGHQGTVARAFWEGTV